MQPTRRNWIKKTAWAAPTMALILGALPEKAQGGYRCDDPNYFEGTNPPIRPRPYSGPIGFNWFKRKWF